MSVIDSAKERLFSSLTHLSEEDITLIKKVIDVATKAHEGQKRSDGSPSVTHAIETATILAEWNADLETVVAGILHDVIEDTDVPIGKIKEEFGRGVASLVEGVTKFSEADFEGEESLDRKTETLRKLFEVMRRDIRVVIIKIADRLHNVRTIAGLSAERQVRFAKETINIYYQLTYHLGMNDVRREFAEICMPILKPEESKEMLKRRGVAEKRSEEILKIIERDIRMSDADNSLVSLRIQQRSLYSLQEEKELTGNIQQEYMIITIAKDRDSCYSVLKLFHTLYRPISSHFHDYIAAPTESSYQTIRSAVIGPKNELILLRIHTEDMGEQERNGVLLKCYQSQHKTKGEQKVPGFSWLERSENLDISTKENSEDFWEALQSDIFQEAITIIVDGDEIHLPQRSTVLDAIYARHGDDANRMKSMQKNAVAVSMDELLNSDDVITTTIDNVPHVSFKWIESTETRYARNLIVGALQERDRSEKITLGRRLVQKELDRYRKGVLAEISKSKFLEIAKKFQRENFEDVLALVGEGVIPARDIFFLLNPEKKNFSFFKKSYSPYYQFNLLINGLKRKTYDILPTLYAFTRLCDIEISHTSIRPHPQKQTFDLRVRGKSPDRLHFANFLSLIERQDWVSHTRSLLSNRQRMFLISSCLLAFGVILIDVLLLPYYHQTLASTSPVLRYILEIVPLLPILAVNYYLLRILQHYIVRMQTSRWFVGLGCLLNLVGLILVISPLTAPDNHRFSLIPFVAIFILSILALGYRFFQTESLFSGIDEKNLNPISDKEWKALKRKKIAGYAIRFCAVIIWGLQPLVLKYSPASEVDPLLLIFLMGLGAFLITAVFVCIRQIFFKPRLKILKIPQSIYLFNIIIGQALFLYFLSTSLQFTTSTNSALFNNFSPVLALLVAALLWRQSIPYLRQAKHILWVFLAFIGGSTGGALIIYSDLRFPGAGSIKGDILAIFAMAIDTLLIISQIRYIKIFPKTPSLVLNLHVFFLLTIATLPILGYLLVTNSSILLSTSSASAQYAIAWGAMLGMGLLLNYEAFRRIDGFIAFLMFNLSILLTFCIEVFFLGKFSPTWILMIGGLIIVVSTIFAECINSHCQKKGL
jgi:GTP diphosphokinase / guanosine-3',5'-bis(diphosphate) 3'-diphosphatase